MAAMMYILRKGLPLPGGVEKFCRAVARIFSQIVEVRHKHTHAHIKHLQVARSKVCRLCMTCLL